MPYRCYWGALSLMLVASYHASGTTACFFCLCSFCSVLLLLDFDELACMKEKRKDWCIRINACFTMALDPYVHKHDFFVCA